MSDYGGSIFGAGGLLGSRIIITTKSENRYEGILNGGNSTNDTIELAVVRSFGTKDRWGTWGRVSDPVHDPAISSKGSIDFVKNIGWKPNDILKVQDIIFKRSCIKDIRVCKPTSFTKVLQLLQRTATYVSTTLDWLLRRMLRADWFGELTELLWGLWNPSEHPKLKQIDAKSSMKLAVQVSEDLADYCCSSELSDFQIKCQGKTFYAHQLILSARCPVFKRMLESNMIEKKRKVIEIEEINSDIVKEMLKYIYTGKCIVNDVNVDPQTAKQLFEAADMYQLDSLKAFCGEVLISSLVPDIALSLLLLGDIYSVEELKKRALAMVVNNWETIRRSDEWKDCIKERSDLIAEITEAMAHELKTKENAK